MQNTKTKIVYALRVHTQLQLLGIPYLIEMKNPKDSRYTCWVYEDTPEFAIAFERIMKEETRHEK